MAVLNLILLGPVVALLLWTPGTKCDESIVCSNKKLEDTQILMYNLMSSMRRNITEMKYRDREIKSMLVEMDNKNSKSNLEPFKDIILTLSGLDKRISNVEKLLNKENRDNLSLKVISKSIQALSSTVKNLKDSVAPDIKHHLDTTFNTIQKRFDMTDTKTENLESQIENLNKNLYKNGHNSIGSEVVSEMELFTKHMNSAEKFLSKYESNLKQTNEEMTSQGKDIAEIRQQVLDAKDVFTRLSAREASTDLIQESINSSISKNYEEILGQGKEIANIKNLLSNVEDSWKKLPTLSQLEADNIKTKDAIIKSFSEKTEEMKSLCQGKEISTIMNLISDATDMWKHLPKQISDLEADTKATNDAIIKSVTHITEDLTSHGKEIAKFKNLLSDAEDSWQNLSRLSEVKVGNNKTKEAINKTSGISEEKISSNQDKEITKILALMSDATDVWKKLPKQFSDLEGGTNKTKDDIMKRISQITDDITNQGKKVAELKNLLSDAEDSWNELPSLSEFEASNNKASEAIINSVNKKTEEESARVSKDIMTIHNLLSDAVDILKDLPTFSAMQEGTDLTVDTLVNSIANKTNEKIERQNSDITKIQNELSKALQMLEQIPIRSEMQEGTSQTMDTLIERISEKIKEKTKSKVTKSRTQKLLLQAQALLTFMNKLD